MSEIKNMLTIDITLGMARWDPDTDTWAHWWGYQDDTYSNGNNGVSSFGSLIVIENNTPIDIVKTTEFDWSEFSSKVSNTSAITWLTFSYDGHFQQVYNLFYNKTLYVTVDGVTYNLGNNTEDPNDPGSPPKNSVSGLYTSPGAYELGAVLKQTGVTKRLYINWE
ncbi:DUF7823 domain-containing protein [Xenorhabdus sp. KK7.4]|uniref:DUF7823 domain-containing protein n=1 Tax=Xenorhabdus sp. KK7.4 TaxID=1851572 RepID=UPI000C041B68|nr:hypothetical protein [Xenorhabdus sp. KK7.4]PHM59100.1 hypothetical protein Xekk_00940 [Xenorhabdus sp. KK7.4]